MMNEIICPQCSNQSPTQAMYCQHCGQPLRCRDCQTELLPTARACIQCGKLIPERATNESFQVKIDNIPPGYNRFKLHETPDVRDLDLMFSNDAIEHIREIFPPLVNNRQIGHSTTTIDHHLQQQADSVEVTSEEPLVQPQHQLPAISSKPIASNEGIWEIFRDYEGRLSQERSDLKATSQKDYIIRLVHLYMYARYQLKDEKVPRNDLSKIIDDTSIKDTNRSKYINECVVNADSNETVRITLDGRNRAQQYLAEILGSQLGEGWVPGTKPRSTNNHVKRSAKKGSGSHNNIDASVLEWVEDDRTKDLVKIISHSIIDTMNVQNRSLFALYCLHKIEITKEIQSVQISKYLFEAFQIQILPDSIPKALAKAVENKPAYATYRKGLGYRITSSGNEYVEKLLKGKQVESPNSTEIDQAGSL